MRARLEEVVMDWRRLLSLYAFARARSTRALGVLAAGAAAGALLLTAGAGFASAPPDSSVTVPTTVGETDSSAWTGTIPPGAGPTNSCASAQDALPER